MPNASRRSDLSRQSEAAAETKAVHASCFTFHVSRFAHGFTLLEVMIVVAIMGIVMTMSVPIVYHIWHREPLNQAVRDVQEVLTNARRRAILSDAPAEVIFHPKERRLEVSGGGGAAPAQSPAGLVVNAGLPAANGSGFSAQISDHVSIDLLDINLIEYRDAEVARVRFYPNGTSDEMILVLHSDRNVQLGIELEVTTGLASVLNEEDLQRMAYGRR